MKYLVTPEHTVTRVKAPGIVVEAQESKVASEIAAKQSRLGDFDEWNFAWNVKKLKENQNTIINRKRKFEDE